MRLPFALQHKRGRCALATAGSLLGKLITFAPRVWVKKWTSVLLIVSLISTQMVSVDSAYGDEPLEEFALVALLVENDMLNTLQRFDGMREEYPVLSAGTIRQRVERYAADIQEQLPYTKTVIVGVDADEEPQNISAVLERLYYEGDIDGREVAKLVGVQLIGDLPIPVVNKNGNRFLSMYPYTDFEEKAYIYNPETGDFEVNQEARDVQPEAWHGVITAPLSYKVSCDDDMAGAIIDDAVEGQEVCRNTEAFETVASFLDKNHLYRNGLEGFADFDQKMLLGHKVVEENVINPLGFANYERYIEHFEDLAYHRYTKELAEELFIEINGELEYETGGEFEIDNDGDGLVDEDGRDDNDADGDGKKDEDGPGDMDGDMCPGECNKDDDRDCKDIDKDGVRSYVENQMEQDFDTYFGDLINNGMDINPVEDAYKSKKFPFPPVIAAMITAGIIPPHSREFCEDELPRTDDPNCYESGHVGDEDYFHPEWDDDEDGFCDEDGTADNDNDGDGLVDEDHGGDPTPETSYFSELPDVQSKLLIDRYLQKYYEQFDKHLGNVNNWTYHTGRYENRTEHSDGLVRNDTDSLIGLISKKDEFVKNYLRAQNEYLEGKIDEIIDDIQEDISLIGKVSVGVTVKYDHDNDSSTPLLSVPTAFEFTNHSIKRHNMPLTPYIWGKPANQIESAVECSLYLGTNQNCTDTNGELLLDANGQPSCLGSKIVETNRVYDPLTGGPYNRDTNDDDETYPDNWKDGDDFGGCFGTNIENPEWCFPHNSKGPIRSVRGTMAVEEDIPVDYRACFDFKESLGFHGNPALPVPLSDQPTSHLYWAENIADVTWKLGKDGIYNVTVPPHPPINFSGVGDSVDNEDEFEIALDYYKDWLLSLSAKPSPYTPYDEILPPIISDPTNNLEYTLGDLLEAIGYDTSVNQILSEDLFANGNSPVTIDDPLPGIEEVTLSMTRSYVAEASGPGGDPVLTPIEDQAHVISSVVQHKEPTNDTIMQQSETKITLDLPVDSPRYTTFRGQDLAYHKVVYPNLFRFESVEDFREGLVAKDTEIASLPGAANYDEVLVETIDNNLNQEMMEDAIEWLNMDIDEKHRYMMTTYLNPDEDPFIDRPQDGYEIMYLAGNGDSEGYNFSYNGAAPEKGDETDAEWLEAKGRSQEVRTIAIQNSIQDAPDSGSGTSDAAQMSVDALPLFEWLEAMVEWVEDLSEDASFGEPQAYCGSLNTSEGDGGGHGPMEPPAPDFDGDGISDRDDPAPFTGDEDGDGMLDGPQKTSRLTLETNRQLIKADGSELIELTVTGQELTASGYLRNEADSFTQVELLLTEEEKEYFEPMGYLQKPLVNGQAQFKLSSTLKPGNIILTAHPINRDDLKRSNEVRMISVAERLNLVTYVHEEEERTVTYDEEVLENLVIKKDDESVVARLDVSTGELRIFDPAYESVFVSASNGQPSHVAIRRKSSEGDVIARIVLESEVFEFKNISTGFEIRETDKGSVLGEGGFEVISEEGRKIAMVDSNGQLFLDDDYDVSFKNDVLSHLLIESPEGVVVFELAMVIDLSGIEVELLEVEEEGSRLGAWLKELFGVGLAHAEERETARSDADRDGLNNMEEFVIGTDIERPDTDGDKFNDSQEVRTGYHPLKVGVRLFNDVPNEHDAFSAIIELYLRGILSGFSDGTFRPERNLTREQFVKINLGAACIDCTQFSETVRNEIDEEYLGDPFPDENISPELYYCVAKGKVDGIVSGYLGEPYEGFFVPGNNISHAEATKVLLETASTFVDDKVFSATTYSGNDRPWFYNYIIEAQSYNLYPDGRFTEVDHLSSDRFTNWFDLEILNNGSFMHWLSSPITRAEFAMMVQNLFQVRDCQEQDSDGDGLPDNSELFQYGTDPFDPDTDEGGVTDGNEVVRNMKPLDASDEGKFEEFEESEDAGEFDLVDDSDGDGLSNEEELGAGTDPENADSDGDGMRDGDEILLGTDPLIDDAVLSGNLGIKGFFIEREVVSRERRADETFTSDVIVPKDILPVSELTENLIFEAQVLNANGAIDFDDNESVVEFIIANEDFAEIERQVIRVTDGIATTTLRSKPTAGNYHVRAEIINDAIASDDASVLIHALDPVTIDMDARTNVMQAGVISRVDVDVMLKDQYENLANYDVYEVELEIEGPARIENTDENENREGLQIFFSEGRRTVTLFSKEAPGDVTLRVHLLDSEGERVRSAEFEVTSHLEMNIEMTHSNAELRADGATDTEIQIRVVNEDGTLLEGFNEVVSLSLSDETLGVLRTDTDVLMQDGIGSAVFRTGTLAGTEIVNANSPGVNPGVLALDIDPLSPAFIQLTADSETLYTREGASVTLTAKLFDRYGNFVADYNGTGELLQFSITPDTSDFGEIENTNPVVTQRGEVDMRVLPKQKSGPINILVKDINEELTPATITLQAKKRVDYEDVKNSQPNVLFASMLGTKAGDVTEENNIGGWTAHSGKTQAVLTLLENPESFIKRAQVKGNGLVHNVDTTFLYSGVLPANDPLYPTRFVVKDIVTDRSLLEVFIKADAERRMYLNIENPALTQEGIFLNLLTDEKSDFDVTRHRGTLNLTEKGRTAVQITPQAQINVVDTSFDLKLDTEAPYPRVTIWKTGNLIAEILLNFSFENDIRILDDDFNMQVSQSLSEGVFIVPHLGLTDFELHKTFNGNSSKNAVSYSLADISQPLPSKQSPGSNYLSLEQAHTRQGIGFEDDNKHILLFTSGMMAGEAMQDNMSEIGILLGDATLSLEPENVSATGFDKTIGTKILNGTELVQDITPYDYNSDGLDDLLVSYKDGDIKLIRNNHALNRFQDAGTLLNIKNGVISQDIADFDGNGFDDIVIAAKESCRADEEICVDMYWNDEGRFTRENLGLTLKQQVHMIRAGDVNNDGDTDIVVSDGAGSIHVFYNNNGVINPEGTFVGNLGVKIDPESNLKEELLIHYPNMPINDPHTSQDDHFFRTLSILDERGFSGGADTSHFDELSRLENSDKETTISDPRVTINKEFIQIPRDDVFYTSQKEGMDLNGDILEPGDVIKYTITLRNTSNSDISDIVLSDEIADSMTLDKESITCEDCIGFDLEFTNTLMRPFIIRNFTVPRNGEVKISYQTEINYIPKVNITLGKNFTDHLDDFLDIAASPEGNTSGIMTYYYSDLLLEGGRVKHTKESFIPTAEDNAAASFDPPDGIDREEILNWENGDHDPNKAPDDVVETLNSFMTDDRDGDGLPNEWDEVSGDISILSFATDMGDNVIGEVLDQAAAVVEDAISKLQCSGGCLATPLNISLLTPGPFNLFGIPVGKDNGIPVFCWGATNTSTVGAASLCEQSSGGRLYLSPTLNGGLVFAVCVGPASAGQCWSFNIPLLQALGVCEEINGAIESVMSKATDVVSSDNGDMLLSMNGQSSSESGGGNAGVVSYNLGSYSVPSSQNSNIRIPGFPSVFTDWIDRQTEELGDLLDLPDIYFIYPDVMSMVGTFNPPANQELEISTLYDALNFMNSLPLIQIESEEVIFKLPAITQVEIEKLQQDAERLTENLKSQLETYRNFAEGASEAPPNVAQIWASTEGQQFIEGIDELIRSIEKNMLVLEEYSKIPEKVMDYRFATSYYVTQIVCYIDAVLNFSGGYVIKNKNRIKAWVKAITDVINAVKTWQDLLQLSISYQESCDKCTTARLSLMELMMKVFVAIPSPPIIDLPKWPDIVLDVSQIQGGITLYFPELKIVPEPVVLPKLPKVFIPQNLPADELRTFIRNFTFPQIEVLPDPPRLPELPELPALPLPRLPDIPPPPDFPELPEALSVTAKGLEKIIKIVCLVKNGFIPSSEGQLKTKVEDLTARGSDLILPIDKGFTIETPDIKLDFVDRIEINTKVNLDLDVTPMRDAIRNVSERANVVTDALSGALKLSTKSLDKSTESVSDFSEDMADTTESADIPTGDLDARAILKEQFPREIADRLTNMENIISDLTIQTETFNNATRHFSEDLVVQGGVDWLHGDDPILNRDIAELRVNQYDIKSLGVPYLAELDGLKQDLISYNDRMHESNTRFGDNVRIEHVHKMFAADGGLALDGEKDMVRFNHVFTGDIGDVTDSMSFESAEDELERIYSETKTLKDGWIYGRPIAGNAVTEMGLSTNQAGGAEVLHKGIYVYNDETGTSERVVNYVKESGGKSLVRMQDFDRDGDSDILYTLGSDIYFKENYKEERNNQHYSKPAKIYELDELMPEETAINMFKLTDTGNGNVQARWLKNHNAVGYELELKHALNDFFVTGDTQTERILVVPEKKDSVFSKPSTGEVLLEVLHGNVEVESAVIKEGTLIAGDLIRTHNGEAVLTFDSENNEGGSQIKLEEDTIFEVPNVIGVVPELSIEGEATVLSGNNIFARTGTLFSTGVDSRVNVNFDTREKLTLHENSTFAVPGLSKGETVITSSDGNIEVVTHPRTVVRRGSKVPGAPRQLLHTLGNSKINFISNTNGTASLSLDRNTVFALPETLSSDTIIEVTRGQIELIDMDSAPSSQPAFTNMLLTGGSVLSTPPNGGATVEHNGVEIELDEVETLQVKTLTHPDRPQLEVTLPNGNYYTKIRSLTAEGTRGTVSRQILFAPQECGDNRAAFASTGPQRKRVAIFKPLEIDGAYSEDLDGDIEEYYYDLDLEEDLDRDGDPTNDLEVFNDFNPALDEDGDTNPSNDKTDPKTTVGPYQDLNTRYMKLWVKDEGGNLSSQEISVEVYVPDIVLSPVAAKQGLVQGYTEPRESEMPFRIVRNRDGMLDTLKDEDGNDLFYTDEDGNYFIDDFQFEEEIIVRNAYGEIIATIDEDTGRILINDDRYRLRALPATETMPTRINLEEIATDLVLATTFLIPEVNTDVSLDSDILYSGPTLEELTGVHIKPLPDSEIAGVEYTRIAATDVLYPGGVNILEGDTRIGLVASNGNIYLFDDGASIRIKHTENPEEPYVLELHRNGRLLAEIYISIFDGEGVIFDYTIGDPSLVSAVSIGGAAPNDGDSDNDGFNDDFELRHQLDPLNPDRDADPDGDGLTNSQEVNLGTNPSNPDTDGDGLPDLSEVLQGTRPTSINTSPFDDIHIDDPLYDTIYDFYTKEIIQGYTSDTRQIFRPGKFITRAEFTKIMLQILCIEPRPEAYEEPPVFNDISWSEDYPWYYPITKESFFRNFITGYLAETDSRGRSPFKPNQTINFAETAKIIEEVLSRFVTDEGTSVLNSLDEIKPGTPWYLPYLEIARDLTPYLNLSKEVRDAFILNEDEIKTPGQALTRYKFIEIAERVLNVYSCYEIDDDGDGLYNYLEGRFGTNPNRSDTDGDGINDLDEILNGLNPTDKDNDPDGDGLTNDQEADIGTDPFDPDTDHGGVRDGDEVERGSNPLYEPDDFPTDASSLPDFTEDGFTNADETANNEEPGTHVVVPACTVCPCPSSIENSADLKQGDIIFTAITSVDNSTIFTTSDPVEFKGITE